MAFSTLMIVCTWTFLGMMVQIVLQYAIRRKQSPIQYQKSMAMQLHYYFFFFFIRLL